MLQLHNIHKAYMSERGKKVKAADGISLEFENKGLVFIVGRSGSGKSTLLNIMGGLDKPDSGELIINGASSRNFTERDYDAYRNRYVGFVFQEYNLIEHKTVRDNIEIALSLQQQKPQTEIDTLLTQLELVDETSHTLADRKIHELSVGQKQRVSIARALIKNPQIILADEPTGALDEQTAEMFLQLCKTLSQDRLIIVVTHNSGHAKTYGDRIITLEEGKLTADTNKEEISEIAPTPSSTTDTPPQNSLRLSVKHRFAMAADVFTRKKFRLATSIFLSAVCFILFGYMLMAVTANSQRAELRALYKNGTNWLSVSSAFVDLSAGQIATFDTHGNRVIPVHFNYVHTRALFEHFTDFADYLGESSMVDTLYHTQNELLAELNPQTGLADADLRIDARFINPQLSRLPQNFTEIALTDFRADYFIKHGYLSPEGALLPIATPDDLIGLSLGDFTITGVFSTDIQYQHLFNHKLEAIRSRPIESARFSSLCFSFVASGYRAHVTGQEDLSFNLASVRLSGNLYKDLRMVNAILESRDNTDGFGGVFTTSIHSIYSGHANRAKGFIANMWLPALILGVIFIIISIVMTLNFLTVSFDYRKRTFGILRALGASKKCVLSIFILETLLITTVSFAAAICGICILAAVMNAVFAIPLFIFGVLPVLILIVLSFGISFLAAIAPLKRFVRLSAVDMIKAT
ncbi:MAG: ATP-binding cassette domain-containing protein [Firmicutes bacterium]|nr:ATP-binding cassette domain-containing protein [Bacillota bacterium]